MSEEASTLPERISSSRPQLLFHGTDRPREELIAEYGLLANRPTLTPNLEIAFRDSQATSIVTCWKPLIGE